jgi:hypothetical protein
MIIFRCGGHSILPGDACELFVSSPNSICLLTGRAA